VEPKITPPTPPAIASVGAYLHGPEALFGLTTHKGARLTPELLQGEPVAVFFGFAHCPDVCPTTLFEVSEILRRLGPDAKNVRALFITVDPERDTPAVLKDYMSSFDPRVIGATGDSAAIISVEKAFRVYAKKVPLDGGGYTMDHTAIVYLMDKTGRFVAPFNMKRRPEEAAADLKRYL
jgi:protein SCO1/2